MGNSLLIRSAVQAGLVFLTACASSQTTPVLATDPSPIETISIASQPSPAISVAGIFIESPGLASEVISPITLSANLMLGAGNRVRVSLIDSSGRVLARKIITVGNERLDAEIAFEINSQKENARLVISTEDEFGRVQDLNSVDLVLLSTGQPKITKAAHEAAIEISVPAQNTVIEGGVITVSGTVVGDSGRPLTIELITREGRVLAFNTVYPSDGKFEISLEYSVEENTWVQIAVTENGGLVPGPARFTSAEVQLVP